MKESVEHAKFYWLQKYLDIYIDILLRNYCREILLFQVEIKIDKPILAPRYYLKKTQHSTYYVQIFYAIV